MGWQNIRHLCWTKLAKKGHLWADLLPKVKLDRREGKWVRNRRTVSQELKVTLLHSKIVIFVKKKTLNWKDIHNNGKIFDWNVCVTADRVKSYVSIWSLLQLQLVVKSRGCGLIRSTKEGSNIVKNSDMDPSGLMEWLWRSTWGDAL